MSQALRQAMNMLRSNVMPRRHEIDRWENIRAGGEAILTIPVGPTYWAIEFILNNLALTDIEYFQFKLNGRPHIHVTPQEMKKLAQEAGIHWDDSRPTLYFGDPSMLTWEGQFLKTMVTKVTDTWKCYVRIKSGVTNPEITSNALTTPSEPERYFLPEIISTSYRAGRAGFNDINIDNEADFYVSRLFMEGSDLEHIEIKRDGTTFLKGSVEDIDADLRRFKRVPQTDNLILDFVQQGFGALGVFNKMAPMGDLVFRVKKASAGDFPVLIEGVRQVTAFPSVK
ncbi:major capsid protein P2 [Vibrio sp. YMD68]|uniref:major capsid protein P2 n=1 Tax=Vibrio sp. YMD68 TaxID=3042300 RepID=UPI00249B7FE9|nr:major capsid protein P2 [Vibrio sp. YMD68]WGW00344.1 major capsid protein P2 [Vibrio sp. YMD68]WGW00975.1 major capsid protein P2 [Vibrio sp. YMD68]